MLRFILGIFTVLFSGVLFAEELSVDQPFIVFPPELIEQGSLKPIELAGYKANVRVNGFVCQTETTLTFYNPNNRNLEGDLVFPLPEGVSVSGYSLDINGSMVDAVAVSKEKARVTLETEIRKGIDPGIVEQQRGNQFKTRIFPLPGNSTRTIAIRFVSTVEYNTEKKIGVYRLPLHFSKPVKDFAVSIEVIKPTEQPTLVAGTLNNLTFSPWSDGLRAQRVQKNFQAQTDLLLEIPFVDTAEIRQEKASDGYTYFVKAIQTSALKSAPQESKTTEIPRKIAIYWDCSGSRSQTGRARQQEKELTFLVEWLKSAKIDSVRLIPIRNTIENSEIQTVLTANLVQAIEKLPADGATNLSAMGEYLQPEELSLLFSDGLSNWGSTVVPRFSGRLFAFSSGNVTDAATLHRFVSVNNGQYFNLDLISTEKAVLALNNAITNPSKAIEIQAHQAEVYPQTLDANSPLLIQYICGRTQQNEASITFNGEIISVKSDENAISQGDLLKTLFGQTKLVHLMSDPKQNQLQIEQLGKDFGMTTPETSLIVLESLEQYQQHDICPPESLPQMRAEYLELKNQQANQQQQSEAELKSERLKYIEEIWQERNQWREAKYDYPANFKYKRSPEVLEVAEDAVAEEQSEGRVLADEDESDANQAPLQAPAASAPQADSTVQESLDEVAEMDGFLGAGGGSANGADFPLEAKQESTDRQPSMEIKQWSPDSPYLKTIEAADNPYNAYLAIKGEYSQSPSFYLECADWFFKKDNSLLAIRILSNLAELDLENPQILRVLGYRLLQYGKPGEAVSVFEVVLQMRPEEPQSYRDLAIALGRRAENFPENAISDYSRALELYNSLVWGRNYQKWNYQKWDDRFPQIEVFGLEEANAMIPAAKKAGVENINFDEKFIKPVDVDIRIVMTWSADNTDIDLWVTEPSNEKVFYGHNRSQIGGLVSRDFVRGYGPEEYLILKAMKGKYNIQAHFYGSSSVQVLGNITVQADVYTNFGRVNQKRQSLTFPLKEAGRDLYDIGTIEF